ncbi:hypothetical protein Pint_12331 [Pistacia integerrima]|uniref:Uncharacterized protein n=1 Tax=Pistacia integerrima TaxID=434235 RepID=A0ACC0XKG8_9ROSI|nr:hypothetical protein Pint_12331 [Pistacia integerrima]
MSLKGNSGIRAWLRSCNYGIQSDLWDIVNLGFTDPTPEEEETYTPEQRNALKDHRKKDKKALFLLYQGLDDEHLRKFQRLLPAKKYGTSWPLSTKE